jgi:hypothetical protein
MVLTHLTRSFFALPGFGGPPIESRTTEINLRFLNEQPDQPRQQISARWRGFFFLSEPQTVEFFAGGNAKIGCVTMSAGRDAICARE